MISFEQFATKKFGRLGNQLFQYAFLRTTARRLGVKFYCPEWIGDKIFQLNDDKERAKESLGIDRAYAQPKGHPCYSKEALHIQDGTDISGYFQTERYYKYREGVKRWYTFKKEAISSVRARYEKIDFAGSVGLHLRLGDWVPTQGVVYHRYIPRLKYYINALSLIKRKDNILIFSDQINKAKEYFKTLSGSVTYMSGNEPYEDLYLMSRCQCFISSPSTLSWWGAWLNPNSDKVIIAPKEGPLRYGRQQIRYYWPDEYTKIRALRPVMDNYHVLRISASILNSARRFKDSMERVFAK